MSTQNIDVERYEAEAIWVDKMLNVQREELKAMAKNMSNKELEDGLKEEPYTYTVHDDTPKGADW
jgi:hypothetical protein